VYYYLYYNTSNKKFEYIHGSISHNNISHTYWEDRLYKDTSDITIDLIDTAFLTIDKIYYKIDDDWVSYDGDGGSVVVVNQILQSGTEIAQISVNGEVVSIYAPTPQNVSVTQTQTSGTEIATINISDTSTPIYAPTTTVTQTLTEGTEIGEVNGTKLYAPSGGSDVTVTTKTSTGTNIADIEVDGTTYRLFAPSGGGGGGEAIETAFVYSNEERVVGVWTDNRPLYQKNIYIGSLTYNTSWHQIPHNISNLGEVVKVYGRFKYLGDGTWYEFPNTRPKQTTSVCVGCNITNIQYMNNWLPDAENASITLQYTKTTDTPGSAPYVTSGSYAHHYSTDEQVVGTWIDGSTLYERVYVLDNAIEIQSGQWYTTTIPANNVNIIVDVTAINTDGTIWKFLAASVSNSNYVKLFQTRGDNIGVKTIILQYTKTS
jgi:hypothetical protein